MSTVAPLITDMPAEIADGSVLAFVLDAALGETVGIALPAATVHTGDIRSALQAISQQVRADVLIVDLGGVETPEGAMSALRSVCGEKMRILAVGSVNDVALYRDLLAAGADDYIVHPVGADALTRAVARLSQERPERESKDPKARKIFVTGIRGGAGVSTFIAGAAWHLANLRQCRTAIVDLDLIFGTTALAFDVEPSHGLREVLENPERVDGLFIQSALAQVGETLAILAAEEELCDPPSIRPGAMDLLVHELERNHDCILIDIPLAEIVAEPRLLAAADCLVVMGEMTLTAIRDIQRLRAFPEQSGIDLPVSLIAGRVPAKGKTEVPAKEFARSLGLAVDHVLPADPDAAFAAARAGQPVTEAAPKSGLAKAVAQTAESLCGGMFDEGSSGGLWNRLKRKG